MEANPCIVGVPIVGLTQPVIPVVADRGDTQCIEARCLLARDDLSRGESQATSSISVHIKNSPMLMKASARDQP